MANMNIYQELGKTLGKTIVGKTERKGRGVFAQNPLLKGELIEISPVVVIPPEEADFIYQTILDKYYFNWEDSQLAIILGFGSIYNHSFQPNAVYVKNFEQMALEFWALHDIIEGEEITINYNGNPEDKTPLIWFDPVE
ncbi:SET domain-containing protein [Kamptonema animale CS-326]|jgi:SET domain-containing protein|nr:SET domain-containing protein [Kamptonema animale CS-326]